MDKSRKILPVGISDFRKIIEEQYYFVDKSLLIKEIINSGAEVTLLTRPRRFGKTLNMNMIKLFFEKSEEETASLFQGLKIWHCEDTEKYRCEQGKYPVVFLTLKDIKCDSWGETYEKLKNMIQLEYNRHAYLLQSECLTKFDRQYLGRILNMDASDADWQDSLNRLTGYLKAHYKTPAILLIDEYDVPIQQGHMLDYYDKVINFMRNWLSGGLKDNQNLKFAVLTGILHIAQESIFSGLNNLDVYTVLDKTYREYFGFTQEEVDEIAAYYDCKEKSGELRTWYNGYNFGGIDIYNPWSVVKYIRAGNKPAPYWLSTSSNDFVHRIIERSSPETEDALKKVMDGGYLMTSLNTQVVYPTVYDNPDNIFSCLVMTGYLKVNALEELEYGEDYVLCIPNEEIACVYKEEILSVFDVQNEGIIRYSAQLRRALFTGDLGQLDELLHKIIKCSVSFYDIHESFYHGWMLALTSMFYDTHYVRSNRESGKGRYDIMMEPKSARFPGIILEFKVLTENRAKEVEEKLHQLAESALQQINECDYEAELRDRDCRSIIKYGIGFYKKEFSIVKG